MASSQADVDKVMAAFGAAPIRYRASQDRAVPGDESASRAFETAALRQQNEPALTRSEPLRPGSGGEVRDVFPLLSRAVPAAAHLSVDAIKRPGDELPTARETEEANKPFGRALSVGYSPDVLPTVAANPAPLPAGPTVAAAPAAPPPAETPEPARPEPLPPLRRHADLIQRLSHPAAVSPPQAAAPIAPQPPVPMPAAPQPAA
jgi:hypothetical protein